MTACQEIGHTLGLAHADTDRTNTNLGTCMDYSNDPTGTQGTNGTLANTAPSATDFTNLSAIYANLDSTQLAYTKPQWRAADALSIGDDGPEEVQAVPEPATWLMMIAGFGGIGALLRRKAAAANASLATA